MFFHQEASDTPPYPSCQTNKPIRFYQVDHICEKLCQFFEFNNHIVFQSQYLGVCMQYFNAASSFLLSKLVFATKDQSATDLMKMTLALMREVDHSLLSHPKKPDALPASKISCKL